MFPFDIDAATAMAVPVAAAPKIPWDLGENGDTIILNASISAAAVPTIPNDLAENGHMLIPKASIPANLPVLGEGAYGKVLRGNLDELAVALKVPLLVCHNCSVFFPFHDVCAAA